MLDAQDLLIKYILQKKPVYGFMVLVVASFEYVARLPYSNAVKSSAKWFALKFCSYLTSSCIVLRQSHIIYFV